MLSRAKYLEKIWIMQPFSQELFARGPPAGPHILMRKLLGEITVDEVPDAWAAADATEVERKAHEEPMKRLFRCTQ